MAKRVLAYLLSTVDLKLVLGAQNTSNNSICKQAAASVASAEVVLEGYSDSSFAPYGERSYGASVVTVHGSPVAWKSGKQGMITLSTMESELLEATNTVTLLECIGCLVDELYSMRVPKHLLVDNSSATAMLCGGPGSWRTRHLRVRCAFVREQVQLEQLYVRHVEGRYQLADLATKAHPRARLPDLLHQWGFEGLPHDVMQLHMLHVIMISCMVVALERFPGAEAADQDKGKDPLASAGVHKLLLVSGCVAVLAVLVWEPVKWDV